MVPGLRLRPQTPGRPSPMPPRFTAAGDAFLKTLTVCLALVVPFCTQALSFSNRYRSPRNPERAIRQSTKLIVLHTTEAGARSSLNKLCERGEAHYCIDEKGVAYRIVDRNREAFHAGRSMWNGKEECDSYSIGIEVVGHHDKPVTLAQLDAIRELVGRLQKEYKIDDAHVVCHSHVAYGAPNKWQKRNHRGRKRCGMLFAMPSVRQRLNLKSKPAYDPDVRARRLVVGDPYLERVLYGKVDTMASRLGRNVAAEEKPGIFSSFFTKKQPEMPNDPEKENYYEKPPAEADKAKAKPVTAKATKVPPPKTLPPKEPPKAPASKGPAAVSTVSTKPSTPAVKGKRVAKEPTTLRELEDRMRYRELGVLGKKSTPYRLVGRAWNAPTTYYYAKGRIIRGDRMDPKKTSPGTRVFIRK